MQLRLADIFSAICEHHQYPEGLALHRLRLATRHDPDMQAIRAELVYASQWYGFSFRAVERMVGLRHNGYRKTDWLRSRGWGEPIPKRLRFLIEWRAVERAREVIYTTPRRPKNETR